MSNFMETNGKAIDNRLPSMEIKIGKNQFRIVGSILRRYGYWVKTPGQKNVFFESLAFDRDLEKFTNAVQDVVPEFYPTKKGFDGKEARNTPIWAYVATVIDRADGKIKELHLKKTYFEAITKVARSKNPSTKQIFGDPTHPVTGWDITLTKEKTGPSAINVKYEVDPFSAMSNACELTEEEIELVEATPSAIERHERPTREAQLELMKSVQSGEYDAKFSKKEDEDAPAPTGSNVDREAVADLA